ncbi:unnamed protein product [Angiostrongylus costaricensis]|uniref:Histidine acid phosphatase n=1 Tax=Angiostrongylus costaricensis TaxID=334426 RepID=A0A158PEV4_ANGCS|nr:unnamed protein product [Angiostrongylus costaricensis]
MHSTTITMVKGKGLGFDQFSTDAPCIRLHEVSLEVWRHGDRLPLQICPTDPIQEDDWELGGGGIGQLTPIYVLSTDVNRTIVSAMSNMLGMYGQHDGSSQAGVDYPDQIGWPAGYVPIPVHTIDFNTNHVGNPEAKCNRMPILYNMAKNSRELQTFLKRPDVVDLFNKLTRFCGKTIDIENLWTVHDTLFIEQIYKNATLRENNTWFTDDLYNKIVDVVNEIVGYENGVFDETVMINNLDIGLEMRKIRGGSLINDISGRMNTKLDCMNLVSTKCNWVKPLKYFVYSAHDTTVYALLSALGIAKKVIRSGGYPPYTSAVFIELWMNQTDNQPYFKVKL